MKTIGDYYNWVEQRRQKAQARLEELTKRHEADPSYENYRAMLQAREDLIVASNTGD